MLPNANRYLHARRTVTNRSLLFPFSAKDKAILEAAYSANPKPDKAARLNIVKRVSLNEKEVQVRIPDPRAPDTRSRESK